MRRIAKLAERYEVAVIGCVTLGEHIDTAIVKELTSWLTACLHDRMSPKRFARIWEKLYDEEPGTTGLPDTVGHWTDAFNYPFDVDDLVELYRTSYEHKADRFIWIDDNAFVTVVAVCGEPGAPAIESAVTDAERTITVMAGEALWPAELAAGAPIRAIWMGAYAIIVTLADGRAVTISDYKQIGEH